jgi:hypothetical protein
MLNKQRGLISRNSIEQRLRENVKNVPGREIGKVSILKKNSDRWAWKEVGTAAFPKAKEHQKVKIGTYN